MKHNETATRACLIDCAKSMGGMATLLYVIRAAYMEMGDKPSDAAISVVGMIDAAIAHAQQAAAGDREAAAILQDRLNKARNHWVKAL